MTKIEMRKYVWADSASSYRWKDGFGWIKTIGKLRSIVPEDYVARLADAGCLRIVEES